MIPYLILLTFVTITVHFGRRYCNDSINRFILLITGASLVLFAGLRDFTVGTDTGNYVRFFHASDAFSYVLERQDTGYYLLSWLARWLSDSYSMLLTLIALIVVTCYLTTIVRLVRRYETAIFLFITLGTYTFFFNGARQGIAAAICFLALPFLLERRLWPYIFLIFVAFFFHRTALIALPLYWLAAPHITIKRILILAFATILSVAFLSVFVNLATELLSDQFASYAEVGEGGGELWVAFLVCQGVLLYIFKRFVPDSNTWYPRLLNIYLIGLVPALTSTLSGVNPSGVLRLHLYFSSTAIILWPMIFQYIRAPRLRILLGMGLIVVTSLFFIMTKTTFSNMTPYKLNQNVFGQKI